MEPSARPLTQRTAAHRRRWAPEKAVSVDVVYRGRRIGGPGLTQALIELLVCEQRVHVCGGREAKEHAVRSRASKGQ